MSNSRPFAVCRVIKVTTPVSASSGACGILFGVGDKPTRSRRRPTRHRCCRPAARSASVSSGVLSHPPAARRNPRAQVFQSSSAPASVGPGDELARDRYDSFSFFQPNSRPWGRSTVQLRQIARPVPQLFKNFVRRHPLGHHGLVIVEEPGERPQLIR